MFKNNEFKPLGLNHGGRIIAVAEQYAIPEKDWLDLSTGLNPNAWPVAELPEYIWQMLPEDADGLQAAANQYYGCEYCLPVAGSQAVIQTLPALRTVSKVGIISPTYAEHEHNWKQAGHEVIQLSYDGGDAADDVDKHLEQLDVLVVINPNNPTGKIFPIETLLNWHQQLSIKGGWLIVDEAFMDVTPERSLLSSGIKPGLIVLRSLGKFFGLAGVRCGFVITDEALLQRIATRLGPWSLTGATRYIAKQALADTEWQNETRVQLISAGVRLQQTLKEHGLTPIGGTALFQWLTHPKAKEIYQACASQGILIRYFENKVCTTSNNFEHEVSLPGLRFGLPAKEEQWQRLINVLVTLSDLINTTETKTYA